MVLAHSRSPTLFTPPILNQLDPWKGNENMHRLKSRFYHIGGAPSTPNDLVPLFARHGMQLFRSLPTRTLLNALQGHSTVDVAVLLPMLARSRDFKAPFSFCSYFVFSIFPLIYRDQIEPLRIVYPVLIHMGWLEVIAS